jgi:hypothetical protein
VSYLRGGTCDRKSEIKSYLFVCSPVLMLVVVYFRRDKSSDRVAAAIVDEN